MGGENFTEREDELWCTYELQTRVNWWGTLELNILPQLSCIGPKCPGLEMPASNSHCIRAVQEGHDLGWRGFAVEEIPEGLTAKGCVLLSLPASGQQDFPWRRIGWHIFIPITVLPWFLNPLIYILLRCSSYKIQVGLPFQGKGSRWKTFPLLQLILALRQMLTISFLHYLTSWLSSSDNTLLVSASYLPDWPRTSVPKDWASCHYHVFLWVK